MSRRKFSRALKRAICIEYMQSGMSRNDISVKYDLPSVNTLSSWINSCLTPLEIHEKCVSLPPYNAQSDTEMDKKELESPDQSALITALQKQIENLEKELKKSQDKNLALNTLIDIAEEQGIRIRKKSGAKQ